MTNSLDVALSQEIAKQIKSQAQDRFNNAYKAACAMEAVKYIQGFLVVPGEPYEPIEHAWIELEERLIDPTLPHLNQPPEDLHYFPAQRLSIKQLKAIIEESKEDYPEDEPLPVYGAAPYEYYGDVMLGGKDYQTAYEQALAKCRELNKPQIKRVD